MKKETYLADFLSKYTIRQLCDEEWNDADSSPKCSHYRHKQRVKKVRRQAVGRSS
ncbi:MAG: hypothetical protein PHI85_11330 [Victivallaceae bacterium]|nr:hypothetical protein [Victivallaceae bacterium]